ncbi:hypothetical protein HDU92_006501 [Lobulomyces angularis]|nr:hypothetical protein HDU92_006501 [Lobulomyces angularis]
MQECPICEKKLTSDQFENHYMKELELVKADKIVEKRTKRNAAILASQQLKKGRKMKLDENEQILCKLKASRLKRQNLDNSDILQFNQKKKKKFLDATEKELSLLNQICFMCQKPLPLDTHLVNLHIDECLAISCNVENASNNLDNGNNSFKKSNDWEEYTWAGQTRVRATSLLQGNYEDIGYSVNKKTDKDVDEDVEIEEESSTIYGNSHLSEEALQQFFTATDENVSELKIDTNVETAFLDENALIVKNLNNDKIDDNLLDVENEGFYGFKIFMNEKKVSVSTENQAEESTLCEISNAGFLDHLPNDITVLDLTHNRLTTLEDLNIDRFVNLKKISLRQNLLTKFDSINLKNDNVLELDLYDNRISKIENFSLLYKNLQYLDLSFNKIKNISDIENLVELAELFLIGNKITVIEGLEKLKKLKNLELGANKIRKIENLDTLVQLDSLWLGKNKIVSLQNLSQFAHLRILSIQSNRINKIEEISELRNLEELYISHNNLTKIENLGCNLNLRVLDVGNNFILKLEGLKSLVKLEELWASYNKLESFKEIEEELGDKMHLHTVYFEGNPLERLNKATYRNKIKLSLKSIKQIDATYCT